MKSFWLTVFVCNALVVRSSLVREDDSVQHLTRLEELLQGEGATFDEPSKECSVQFRKVGCFKDKMRHHSLSTLVFNERDNIDWAKWSEYVQRTVCACAEQAESRGFSHFGVQYFGECWSGPQNNHRRFDMYGASRKCIGSKQSYDKCDDNSKEYCVGRGKENYVYEIVSGPESGSGIM